MLARLRVSHCSASHRRRTWPNMDDTVEAGISAGTSVELRASCTLHYRRDYNARHNLPVRRHVEDQYTAGGCTDHALTHLTSPNLLANVGINLKAFAVGQTANGRLRVALLAVDSDGVAGEAVAGGEREGLCELLEVT